MLTKRNMQSSDWIDDVLTTAARADRWGYAPNEPAAAEPAALCSLALVGHGRHDAARPALEILTTLQAADGSLGVHPGEAAPHWGTAYAVLAWQAALRSGRLDA